MVSAVAMHAVQSDRMKIPRIPYTHLLKYPAVRPKDAIAEWMQKYSMSDLPPRLHVSEAQPLPEINEKFDQANGRQEV